MQAYMNSIIILRILFFLSMTIIVNSCIQQDERRFIISTIDKENKAQPIDYLNLTKNYKSYQGKYVDVKGLFSRGFEHFGICYSGNTANEAVKCFWLAYNHDLKITDNDFNKMIGKVVRIKGVFDTTSKGHLSMYVGTIRDIYFWEQQ
jgi:hypothetical protein